MARLLRSFLPILTALAVLSTSSAVDAAPRKKTPTRTVPAAAATKAPTTPPPSPPGEIPLFADGAIVIDGLTGEALYEKNADESQFPASTTKILTALLVIEAGNLDHQVEITVEDSKVGESSLYIKPGQLYTRRQMLYGLMLKSANDVAYALGRDNAGSMEAFGLKMTQRARELGATNSNFRNPHGLHDKQHFCSPRDLAMVTRAAMQQPLFRQIVSTRSYEWAADTGLIPLNNHNRLLARFPGCTGVKTGYTNPAQQVLVSAALRGNREVIAVVMHTNKPGIWNDSMLLLSYGLEHTAAEVTKMATGN